jgi:formylglycine-generating enzyme required for sulfatase activity
MIQSSSITTAQLNEQILKYLKPEISQQPLLNGHVNNGQSVSLSARAEGKYLTYQWKKNGINLPGETNPILSFPDINASQHNGNYTLVVTNDFGRVESVPLSLSVRSKMHSVELNSSVNLEMLWVEPGTFTMGSPTTEAGRTADREDEHNVSLTKGFYLGKYEVTQAQYEAVMTGNTDSPSGSSRILSATPSKWPNNPNRPVETVLWADAQIFLTRLNAQQSANIPAGWAYVLPTESQWEYACRAGTSTVYSWGDDINATHANYSVSGLSQTRDVAQYSANPWGFFDMHGNAGEWTADWYQAAYPTGNLVVDPTGPVSGSHRVYRGFSFCNTASDLRSAKRGSRQSGRRAGLSGLGLGFRVGFQFIVEHSVDLNSTVDLEMLWVEPGTFTMGSPTTEAGRSSDETEHNVTLTKGFYLGKYEVTQGQYETVMSGNTDGLSATPSSWPNNPNRPVEKVSWADAQIFLTRLNTQQSANIPAGWAYVLPTESQWEYACRAGTSTVYSWGDDINSSRANYNIGQTSNVGNYAANAWGFFDMHGNVWEWTADWGGTYPADNPVVNPTGAASGSHRVLRGGSWGSDGTLLRSAKRHDHAPSDRGDTLGFRVGFQFIGELSVDLNSTVNLEMLWVEPGTFTMGSPTTEVGRGTDEVEHNVTLTKGFYLGKYEVTQAQYQAVMTGNSDGLSATPSQRPNNPNRPVDKVSWDDVQIFLTRLNTQQSANIPAGWAYVLPTESQWEYACRAGTSTVYSWGDDINATHANYSMGIFSETRDVAQYSANPWGFFDMHGNVWELTADRYQAAYPTGNPVVDPTGAASGSDLVGRGGSWNDAGSRLRSAWRDDPSPSYRSYDFGFRVGFQKQ